MGAGNSAFATDFFDQTIQSLAGVFDLFGEPGGLRHATNIKVPQVHLVQQVE